MPRPLAQGGTVVNHDGSFKADVLIEGRTIKAVAPDLEVCRDLRSQIAGAAAQGIKGGRGRGRAAAGAGAGAICTWTPFTADGWMDGWLNE